MMMMRDENADELDECALRTIDWIAEPIQVESDTKKKQQ